MVEEVTKYEVVQYVGAKALPFSDKLMMNTARVATRDCDASELGMDVLSALTSCAPDSEKYDMSKMKVKVKCGGENKAWTRADAKDLGTRSQPL